MGTRKLGESHIRNLTQNSSGSYQLTIPKNIIKELEWRQGQKVVVKKSGDKILIQDWK